MSITRQFSKHRSREDQKLLETFETITFNGSNYVELKKVTCDKDV